MYSSYCCEQLFITLSNTTYSSSTVHVSVKSRVRVPCIGAALWRAGRARRRPDKSALETRAPSVRHQHCQSPRRSRFQDETRAIATENEYTVLRHRQVQYVLRGAVTHGSLRGAERAALWTHLRLRQPDAEVVLQRLVQRRRRERHEQQVH